MKVLLWGRPGVLGAHGSGDRTQIVNTQKELEKLGVDLAVSDDPKADLSSYDIVHIFQMDWGTSAYYYSERAKDEGKIVVLSPIHHSVKEVKRFDDEYVFDYRRVSKFIFREQHQRDVFKNLYRSFFKPSLLPDTLKSFRIGLKKMHTQALRNADIVLVQTNLEARLLKDTYGVDIKWVKVPNGVGDHFLNTSYFKKSEQIESFKDYILCVGRIEPRKNQLSVIKAVNKLRKDSEYKDLNLVLIGNWNKNHIEYSFWYMLAVKKYLWLHSINYVPYEEIPAYFHFAKLTVSASWFESTGLTLLESMFCGTNAVATGEQAKEFLGDMVEYCDPGDIESIKNAIKAGLKRPPVVLSDTFKQEHTWKNVGEKTLEVYEGLM